MASNFKKNREEAEAFARDFFRSNPGASQHQCLKALSNAHLHTLPHVVARVRDEFETHRLKQMIALPSKPEPTLTLVVPTTPQEEEESMATPNTTPVTKQEAINAAGVALKKLMREHGLSTLMMSLQLKPDGKAELEVDFTVATPANTWTVEL